MDLMQKYYDLHSEMIDLCDKNRLDLNWNVREYPITATITEWEDENKDQIKMSEEFEKETMPGMLVFEFADELTIKITDDFNISEELLNKLKGKVKKLHYQFLQSWYRQIRENNNVSSTDTKYMIEG